MLVVTSSDPRIGGSLGEQLIRVHVVLETTCTGSGVDI